MENEECAKRIEKLLCEQKMMVERMNTVSLSCQNYVQVLYAMRKSIKEISESLILLVNETKALNS